MDPATEIAMSEREFDVTTPQGSMPCFAAWPDKGQHRFPLAFGVHLVTWLRDNHSVFVWLAGPDGTPGGAINNLFARSDLREKT